MKEFYLLTAFKNYHLSSLQEAEAVKRKKKKKEKAKTKLKSLSSRITINTEPNQVPCSSKGKNWNANKEIKALRTTKNHNYPTKIFPIEMNGGP